VCIAGPKGGPGNTSQQSGTRCQCAPRKTLTTLFIGSRILWYVTPIASELTAFGGMAGRS